MDHFTSAPLTQIDDETQFVQSKLVELIISQRNTIAFGGVAVAAALFTIGVTYSTLYYWLAWMVLFFIGIYFHWKYRSNPFLAQHTLNTPLIIKRCAQVQLSRGIIFGLCLLFFPTLSDIERQIFTVIVMGLTVGAIATNSGHVQLYWGFSAPLLLTLGAVWIIVPSHGYSAIQGGFVGILILTVLTPMYRNYAKTSWVIFDESCRLRFRERALNAQLQEALQVAEQANRAKSRFLAAASHDLRQPLHVIGFIGSALKLRKLDDKSTEMVTLLNKASSSLQTLLNSLLDVSKLDSGLIEVQPEAVNISRQINEFYQSLEPMILAKGLRPVFENTVSNDLMTVTDSVLLLRILNNLAHNALKFTHNGQIKLGLNATKEHIIIEISDTGCGIAREHQDEVFHEFFQVSNQERDISQGLGLGLSIVRRVARLLNAQIELISAVGQGTTIRTILPIVQPDALYIDMSVEQVPVARHETRAQFHLNVLVIDDDAGVLEASRLLLNELGCVCWIATNIDEARGHIDSLQSELFDLIMVDLRLKGSFNGIDIIQLLRHELGEPQVEAFIISGDTDPERLMLAKNANIHICHKPLTLEKLSEELKRVKPRLQDKN